MTGYELLGNAIIVQACHDYRAAFRKLRRYPHDPVALGEIQDLEQFFLSAWFGMLTDADGQQLLDELRKACEQWYGKRKW